MYIKKLLLKRKKKGVLTRIGVWDWKSSSEQVSSSEKGVLNGGGGRGLWFEIMGNGGRPIVLDGARELMDLTAHILNLQPFFFIFFHTQIYLRFQYFHFHFHFASAPSLSLFFFCPFLVFPRYSILYLSHSGSAASHPIFSP